jgi:predicted nucleic acid-binding protein
MALIDANLLLYAYDPSSPHHPAARVWLENTLSGREQIGLAWMTVLAFFRTAQAHVRWNIRFPSLRRRPLCPDGSNVPWQRS